MAFVESFFFVFPKDERDPFQVQLVQFESLFLKWLNFNSENCFKEQYNACDLNAFLCFRANLKLKIIDKLADRN